VWASTTEKRPLCLGHKLRQSRQTHHIDFVQGAGKMFHLRPRKTLQISGFVNDVICCFGYRNLHAARTDCGSPSITEKVGQCTVWIWSNYIITFIKINLYSRFLLSLNPTAVEAGLALDYLRWVRNLCACPLVRRLPHCLKLWRKDYQR
jgi:hypothetical protein